MFRPYNFKSIALWTAGALAGNEAYHTTKARYSVGGRRQLRVPASITALANRLDCIEATFRNFGPLLKKSDWITNDQWDLTEFARFFVFAEWINSQKTRIKADLQRAYNQSVNRYPWAESIAESYRNIGQFVDVVRELRDHLKRTFSKVIVTDAGRELLFATLEKYQSLCHVDDLTCQVINRNENRLIIGLRKTPS
jgi:hypothetical protein